MKVKKLLKKLKKAGLCDHLEKVTVSYEGLRWSGLVLPRDVQNSKVSWFQMDRKGNIEIYTEGKKGE